jgi:hypothetical protein
MKVLSAFVGKRQRAVEKVQQESFAATDAAPKIEAAHGFALLAGELCDLAAPTARRRGPL